jgi:tetratricopeptide (TPR) repeat protein
MKHHRPEQPEVSRDPELQEAFDAFLHQTHVPRDFQARVAALTDQLAALQEQRRAPQEPLVASVLDQAGVAFNQGRYDDAIALSEAVIRVEPTDSRAYLQVGRAYAAKGRDNEAVAAFNKGLQQNPGSAQSHAIYQELGIVYSKQGRDDEAITALQEATKLAPHNFHAQHMLGAAYLQKGLKREAHAALEEALRLAKASPGGKESVPSIEAMLSYLPPLAPSAPTAPPPRPFKVALEAIKYKLTVQVTPADSTIKFDKSQLEYRPGMELSPGRYDLVVTREGYKPARKPVMISTADVTLDVTLEMLKYKLTVQATPADSTVKFDNSKVEYWPGVTVEPGRYEVVVTRNGYKPARRWVTIADADVSLDVALEPEKYKLTVRAKPADSSIKLANSTEEYQPGMELAPGRYEVVVERQGYKMERRWVTLGTADITVDVALEPDKAPPTQRLALLIGNAKYPVNPLRNAVNDASDMNYVLKKLGFETTLLTNATFEQMEDAIDGFSRKLRQGGVGLFYYVGHGVQIDGQNYLVPVDAPLQAAATVKYRSVPANGLRERMADAGNELNIIILDACRDNVFMGEWRSVQRGLAIAQAAQGLLIAYATAPGAVALEGSGRNGVYTKHLLRYITRRGITAEELFKLVRNAVAEETKGKQIPWENSSLLGDFYFAGK